MSQELVQQQQAAVATQDELSVEEVLRKVEKVQSVMRAVMKKDKHYGVIPGCDKPSLWQPGAQVLCFTFRLRPEFEIQEIPLPDGHLNISVKCRLYHIPTGNLVAEGVGSCSTMESKYRYRTGPVEYTGKPVPDQYWSLRETNPEKAQKLLGGPGYTTRKNPDTKEWEIVKQGARVENSSIADVYNTVLKMAKKRAYVDAAMTGTAAADCFTQDVDEDNEIAMTESWKPAPTGQTKQKPPISMPKPAEEEPPAEESMETTSARGDNITAGHITAVRSTTCKNGSLRYGVLVDGTWYGTFDAGLGAKAKDFKESGEEVVLTWKAEGNYKTLTSLAAAVYDGEYDEPEPEPGNNEPLVTADEVFR